MTRPPHMKLVDATKPPEGSSYAASSAFIRWEQPDDLTIWTDGVIRDMNGWLHALLSWTRKP